MKPSDEEDDAVNDTPAVVVRAPDQIWLCVGDMYDCRGCEVEFDDIKSSFEVSWCEEQIDESDVKYVRADLYEKLEAELQRRHQPLPVGEAVSVPAELVIRLRQEAALLSGAEKEKYLIEQAAAYGREQAQWQPIETAPKDGTRINLYFGTISKPTAIYGEWYEDRYAKTPRPYWRNDWERSFGITWCREHAPTHWQPITSPKEPPTC